MTVSQWHPCLAKVYQLLFCLTHWEVQVMLTHSFCFFLALLSTNFQLLLSPPPWSSTPKIVTKLFPLLFLSTARRCHHLTPMRERKDISKSFSFLRFEEAFFSVCLFVCISAYLSLPLSLSHSTSLSACHFLFSVSPLCYFTFKDIFFILAFSFHIFSK